MTVSVAMYGEEVVVITAWPAGSHPGHHSMEDVMSRTSSALLVGAGAVTASASLTIAFALGAATTASPAGSQESITLTEASSVSKAHMPAARGSQPRPAQLNIVTTRTDRQVLELGDDGISSGTLSFSEGDIQSKRRGDVIGRFVFRGLALDSDEPGGLEDRDIAVEYTLPDGLILVAGVVSAPRGLPPATPQDQVIVGGTGRYAGAGGSVSYVPINKNQQRVIFTFAW